MISQSASLLPHNRPDELVGLQLSAEALRISSKLELRYRLEGPIDNLIIPTVTEASMRSDYLWKHTCFEAFWGIPAQTFYWELNISPNSNWNIYKFNSYRNGQSEDEYKHSLNFSISKMANSVSVGILVELDPQIPLNSEMELGFAAVLKQKNGNLSYWALSHNAKDPDFHQRDSFLLKL